LPRIPSILKADDQEESGIAQMSFFSEEQDNIDYKIVDTEAKFEEMISVIKTKSGFSFDTETTSINPLNCELVGISFSVDTGKGWYIPISHKDGTQLSKNSVLSPISYI
jgi:DNA polymerase-1